jgi:hypothetical protein
VSVKLLTQKDVRQQRIPLHALAAVLHHCCVLRRAGWPDEAAHIHHAAPATFQAMQVFATHCMT